MLILSIDSAGNSCGACVWRDGKILAEAEEGMERGQDRRLMPLILSVMEKAHIEFADLDRIAVTRGPGSFTGLRIGLAAARGIGLAADRPVIGIDRFAIYRLQIQEPQKSLLVVINSKRKELFCRYYPAIGVTMESILMTPEEIAAFVERKENTIIAGDNALPGIPHFHQVNEKEIVTCAALAAIADPDNPHFLPRPLYIREPDVTIC